MNAPVNPVSMLIALPVRLVVRYDIEIDRDRDEDQSGQAAAPPPVTRKKSCHSAGF